MKRWAERVREEAYLLNPAFSAINLTVALAGYESRRRDWNAVSPVVHGTPRCSSSHNA